mmetsp:Transcript_24311/g.61641  ORF Transcript_24311/g.61641 Transcript_24311/m.61641 type:complete len:421 (+) Transcript_24311:88-1350(+)
MVNPVRVCPSVSAAPTRNPSNLTSTWEEIGSPVKVIANPQLGMPCRVDLAGTWGPSTTTPGHFSEARKHVGADAAFRIPQDHGTTAYQGGLGLGRVGGALNTDWRMQHPVPNACPPPVSLSDLLQDQRVPTSLQDYGPGEAQLLQTTGSLPGDLKKNDFPLVKPTTPPPPGLGPLEADINPRTNGYKLTRPQRAQAPCTLASLLDDVATTAQQRGCLTAALHHDGFEMGDATDKACAMPLPSFFTLAQERRVIGAPLLSDAPLGDLQLRDQLVINKVGSPPGLSPREVSAEAEEEDKDSGDDDDLPATTVMLRNIACRYSQEDVADALDDVGLAGTYDLVYIPRSPTRRSNLGYAFVYFRDPKFVEECIKRCDGKPFGRCNTSKLCKVALAHIKGEQGLLPKSGKKGKNRKHGQAPLYAL